MKIYKFLILFLFTTLAVCAQENYGNISCSEEIKKLDKKYIDLESEYKLIHNSLDSLKQKLNVSITDKLLEDIKVKNKLKISYNDSLVVIVANFKHFEAVCKLTEEELEKLFNHPNMDDYDKGGSSSTDDSNQEAKVYLYFGENKVISEEILTNDNKETEILKGLISGKVDENYLGDITIPKDGEEFFFYSYIPRNNDNSKKDVHSKEESDAKIKEDDSKVATKQGFVQEPKITYKFKKVHVEIAEGIFSDIRVIVETSDGNTHVYENKIGVSILRFSAGGKKDYLFYKHSIRSGAKSEKFKDKKMDELFIKLSDVFIYDYKLGNNYVPSDLVLELPVKDAEGKITNKNGFATYKIKEESHISGIVELRAYTDFLALFGDSDNGLVQIEGKADFYVLPFPMSLFGNSNLLEFKFLNKISPKVNYSRFDEDTRYVEPVLDSESQNFNIKKELDLIEKRYLTMGVDVNILQFKRKGVPFTFDLFGTLNYQLTELNYQDEISNIKAVSYGPSARLNFKKFNNFGLNYSAYFSWYDYKNFNEGLEDILPEKFRVFSNEFEIFYFPEGNQNQSIFLRLRTFNNSESKNNEAFYQFQFGYRFAIGTKSIKKS